MFPPTLNKVTNVFLMAWLCPDPVGGLICAACEAVTFSSTLAPARPGAVLYPLSPSVGRWVLPALPQRIAFLPCSPAF